MPIEAKTVKDNLVETGFLNMALKFTAAELTSETETGVHSKVLKFTLKEPKIPPFLSVLAIGSSTEVDLCSLWEPGRQAEVTLSKSKS